MNQFPAKELESSVARNVDSIVRGFLVLSLVVRCVWIAPNQASAQEETNLQPVTVHIGFTLSSFRNVNAHDATTAFRIFAQTAARKRGFKLTIDSQVFDNSSQCEAEIKKGKINMAILDTWDYLNMNIQSLMEPTFVEKEQGAVYRQYMVLTHRGSGLTNLASLRGKELLLLEGKGGDLSRAWLDSVLLTNHLDSGPLFFGKMTPSVKPASAVFPVFFGNKPACLVDHAAFQIMAELNPQVGSNLVPVAISDPYLENTVCVSRDGWPSAKAREGVLQGIAELQLEPDGQQVLELFKVDKLVPFKDEYLDSTRALQRTLAGFEGKQAKR